MPSMAEESTYLFNNNEHVIQQIYAFLPAEDQIQHERINRFCHRFLPLSVSNVSIDVAAFRTFPLHKYSRIRHLRLYSVVTRETTVTVAGAPPPVNPTSVRRPRRLSVYNSCSKECPNLPLRTNDRAEDVILKLAGAIRNAQLPALQDLSLQSCFINSSAVNSMRILASALQAGTCPNLKSFKGAGNCAGDLAAIEIAQLITSRACPKLQHLDLRNNFIGEDGGMVFARALQHPECSIDELCLGGNILIDSTLKALSKALLDRHGKQMMA